MAPERWPLATVLSFRRSDRPPARVRLRVVNPRSGFLFGYEGRFTCAFPSATAVPADLLPRRHERRL